jgi:DNA repair protein RecO (recombination protein O)
MNWDDIGFLISKNRYNENSIISEIYTKNHGKTSGIIFGGTSKKIKNYLQLGNQLHVNFNSKSENKIGYFKVEIIQPYSPIYFDDHQKLSCISSAMNLIKILTADSQKNNDIYILIEKFYEILRFNDWLKNYIFWELDLFKTLGYHLELDKLVDKETINDVSRYISKSSFNKKIVPNFLIDKDENTEDLNILLEGLKLVGDFLDKTILRPNNIKQPISRINFINSLK